MQLFAFSALRWSGLIASFFSPLAFSIGFFFALVCSMLSFSAAMISTTGFSSSGDADHFFAGNLRFNHLAQRVTVAIRQIEIF